MTRLLRILAIAVVASSGLISTNVPMASATTPTNVSITFDDGLVDQIAAAAALDSAGMDATFFINSGRIGTSSTYMTRADLDALAAAGHEIAGHTVSHLNLAALTPDGQRRQICNDRNTLMGWGFAVKNFAYPFSAYNSDTISIVQECGYNSARGVSGLVSQNACNGCAYAESVPPANPWVIRTPDSIKVDTTLASLKSYVTQAEDHGGGWVPLVFHHVCNACDPNAITPADFQAFITWLAARPSTTEVKTVDEVIGGQLNPAPPITPVGPGTGELQNPGLELDTNADAQADCWQRAGFGTNSATFTRSSDAHSGSFAERIDMTSYTDGARRLVVRQDDGTCSPAISAGDTATISVWYKSNATVRFSIFYRDGGDVWHSWNTSPIFPASAAYTRATYTTPELPAGAIGISWGLNLQAVGFLVTDDYAMDIPIHDTVSPIVGLLAPAEGETLSGHGVSLSATAEDEVAVAKVDFLVNGAIVGTDMTAPYGVTWDSTTVANGSASVQARATDTSGNTGLSDLHSVTVDNSSPGFGVLNGGLEEDVNGDSLPDCWQTAGTGANAFTFTRSTDAHSGGYAERIDISSYTDGSRRLVVKQDLGQCAIAVAADHSYTLSAWVKGTASSRLTAFYRDAAGTWVTWANGPLTAASAAYSQLVWTTPPVPVGATHLSFGVSLAAAGTITVDDHTVAADTAAPSVSLTAPVAGSTVAGSVSLTAAASDNVGISKVEFLADNAVIGTDLTSPYSLNWDSTTSNDGPVNLTARATDTSTNVTTSAPVAVTVANQPQGWGVQNASLEIDANSNGVPDCWQTSGSGTNTFAFSRVTDAHTGSFAEKLDITAYTSGGRRMIPTLETVPGTCAIPVVPGLTYTLTAWVKGTGTIRMTAFYGVNGVWPSTNVNGPTSAAPATWTQLSWTTAAVPAGTTHISFGVTLQSLGSITVDDHAISGTPPPDTAAPTVSLTAPANGEAVHGSSVTLSALAGDDRGLSSVEFLVNGNVVGTDTTAPYSIGWDSTSDPDGPVSITARATDTSSNATTSSARSATVDNTGPTSALTAPANGAILTGPINLAADASDSNGVSSVEFLVGGNVVGSDATAPYAITWNSTTVADGPVSITARATDGLGNRSTTDAVGATVQNSDTTDPTASLTAPADGATVGGNVIISAVANDNIAVASVDFLVGDTVVGTDTTSPYSITWNSAGTPNGTPVTISARATDTSANVTTSATRSVTVDNSIPDTTAPTVSVTAPIEGATLTGSAVPISADAADNVAVAAVEFFVDATSVGIDTTEPYSVTWDSTTVLDGPVSITAVATDTNTIQASSAVIHATVDNAVHDTTPPAVSVTEPTDNAFVSGASVTISADATDDFAIGSVEFFVGATGVGTDTTSPYAMTWDSTTVPDGNVSITARATDTSDNATTSAARTARVDNTDPTVAITTPAGGASLSGAGVVVSASASDASGVASVEFFVGPTSIGADTTAPFSVTWDTTETADGPVSITAVATDAVGNATTSAARTAAVDNTAPDVSISQPADGETVAGPVNIFAAVIDTSAVSVEFLIDGTVINTDSVGPSYDTTWDSTSVPDGPVSVSARATDAAGHVTTSAAISVTVQNIIPDTTPPTVNVSAPADGATIAGTVTISATAGDDIGVATVDFLIDETVVGTDSTAPYSIVWDSTSVADGDVVITAKATDTSSNATTSTPRTVTVQNADLTLPVVSLTAPAAGTAVGGNAVTISATATDNVAVGQVEFLVGGAVVGTDTTSPYSTVWDSTTTPNGPVSITARATDTSDNAATSAARSVTVDNDPPTVALTAPADGAVVSGKTVTISATATDVVGVARVDFYVGTSLIATDASAPYSIKWNINKLGDGAYVLTARATDNTGLSATSVARTVTIRNDGTAPAISVTSPADGATVSGTNVTIGASASDNVGVATVEFYVGATLIGTDTSSPYTTVWDSTSVPDGAVSITAKVTDMSGNTTTSAARTVTVRNGPVTTTIANAGLEADGNSDGIPDCWAPGGSGNNTVTYARVSDSHSGSFAERITVSRYRNGSATFDSLKDSGSCAIAITAGRSYTVGAWYKSDAAVRLTVSYRNSSGSWVNWTTSSAAAASASWSQISFTTPALPAGATHLSFGVSVSSIVTLTVDDHSIAIVP
jgi:peptidoglycan/xylan/chitin deacetylase (PgdA/CDA1 family)